MGDYGLLERILHRLILSTDSVSELLFGLEKRAAGDAPPCRDAVYVTGLARAGTTALLQSLHATREFSSSTCADMPFVLAPNLWANLRTDGRDGTATIERAHGDGIRVGLQSAEAFEEVFWRMSCADAYIRPGCLLEHRVPAEVVAELRSFQRVVCRRYGAPRYLAKNNNHVLRLRSLAPQAPDMLFLVVFRDPSAHCASLLRQHQRFLSADDFTRQYMTWLVHHEFGATHRPFVFGSADRPVEPELAGPTLESPYWVARWIDVYSHLLDVLREGHPNIIPVSHERLCSEPEYRISLARRIGVSDLMLPERTSGGADDRLAGAGCPSTGAASEIHAKLDAISWRALLGDGSVAP